MSNAVALAVLVFLTTAALRSLALVAAMELVLWPVQKHAPRTALSLCKLALLAALAMLALPYLLPAVRIPLGAPAVVGELAVDLAPSFNPARSATLPPDAGQSLAPPSAPAPANSTNSGITHWPQVLLAVYPAGVLVLGVRLATGLLFARRLRRTGETVDAPLARELLSSLSHRLGLRRPPPLLSSHALITPVTVGLWRPAILLPETWKQWDQATWSVVLTHELGHAARRDPLALFVAELYRTLFWFHPAAWWLRRRLAELAEAASDDLVLASGIEQHRYASVLLAAMEAVQAAGGRLRWPVTAMARQTQCTQRLERILAWQPGGGFFSGGAGRMFSVLALVAVVGSIASVRLEVLPKIPSPATSPVPVIVLNSKVRPERRAPDRHSTSAWPLRSYRGSPSRADSRTRGRPQHVPQAATVCPSCPDAAANASSDHGSDLLAFPPGRFAPAPEVARETDRELQLLLDLRRRPPVSGSTEIWLRWPEIWQQIWQAERQVIELEQIRSRIEQQMLQLENQLRHLPGLPGLPFNGVPGWPAMHPPVPLERINRPTVPPRLSRPARAAVPVLRATV